MTSIPLISLVSLGPGDPELMTLKSLRRLQEAEIICCPGACRAGDGVLVSRAAQLVRAVGIDDEKIHVFDVPMEKERRRVLEVYRREALQVAAWAAEGRRVAIAVEGDAGIYASIHYMSDFIVQAGFSVEQCAGIPSFIAAGAEASLLLIGREERMVVVPGNVTEEELEAYLSAATVPVIMKLSRCREVLAAFIAAHPEHEYHYFENVGCASSFHTTDCAEILSRSGSFPYFSLMIIRP